MAVRDVVQAAAGVGGAGEYIEDVFSTYLYTGNSSARSIVNNINLAEEGGLVWVKSRGASRNHHLVDTERGPSTGSSPGKTLWTNSTNGETVNNDIVAFNTDGFNIATADPVNNNNENFVSWTFRKAPKFFDVVTWSGNGVSGRQIPHNLDSMPGCIIVKCTNASADWMVWHRSSPVGGDGRSYMGKLNTTDPINDSYNIPRAGVYDVTSSDFKVLGDSNNAIETNLTGNTYVAYVFAHNAGNFGDDNEQNVISCGSFTGGADVTVNLGYEPQWVLTKAAGTAQNWTIHDTMRGYTANPTGQATLHPNRSDAEDFGIDAALTSTGFRSINSSTGVTYIYIAIRRGPMKTPEAGTEVFAPVTGSFSSPYTVTTNFPVDLTISGRTAGSTMPVNDRLRGGTTNSYAYLNTRLSDAELTGSGAGLGFQNNTAVIDTSWSSGGDAIWWNFRRAPGFMDVVCYTGTGGATTFAHNLAAVPELMIAKNRSQLSNWAVYHKDLPLVVSAGPALNLDRAGNLNPYDFGLGSGGYESPTSSVFTVGPNSNSGTDNFVAYLFASCPGVSKVGSYTGTGTTLQIDCGFSAGARFILIKRTDSTGDWYVWDSARGISAGNDPYILINDSPQVTTTDYIDPLSSGFTVTSNASSTVNVDTGTYIFLAIA
jgi:hypothetical protein